MSRLFGEADPTLATATATYDPREIDSPAGDRNTAGHAAIQS